MFGSDRSWDSDWRGSVENGRGDAFFVDAREGREPGGKLKDPVFDKSMAHRFHRQEAHETSHGKVAERSRHADDDRKKGKDAQGAGKNPGLARGNEDVDAVWHRGSRPRNF